MRIHVPDASMVNWDNVLEKVHAECNKRAVEVVKEAMTVLGELKPGERRTLPIRVGSITVSVPK